MVWGGVPHAQLREQPLPADVQGSTAGCMWQLELEQVHDLDQSLSPLINGVRPTAQHLLEHGHAATEEPHPIR
jgi:hypothetical protein